MYIIHVSTYIGFMSLEMSVEQSISLHVININKHGNRGDKDKIL